MDGEPNLTVMLPKPESDPVVVDIKPERVITDAEFVKAMEKAGSIQIPVEHLRNMEAIGIMLGSSGVIKNQRGSVFITQTHLHKILAALSQCVDTVGSRKGASKMKVAQLISLSKALGYCASKLTESHSVMLESAGGGAASEGSSVPPPQRKTFGVGQVVAAPPVTKPDTQT